MFKIFIKQKWCLVIILALIIIEPSINSWMNFWLQNLFNYATIGASVTLIMRLLTIGFLIWLIKRFVIFTSSMLRSWLICNARYEIKHRIFSNILKFDVADVSSKIGSGEYIAVFINDISILEQRYFDAAIGVISNIISILILGSSLFVMNRKLAVAIISFGVLTMFVPYFFSKKLSEKNLAYSEEVAVFTQHLKEYFSAYPTIKNYSIEESIAEKFGIDNSDTEGTKFNSDYTLTLANSIGSMVSWFMQIIGVGLGLVMVVNGEILVGTVVAARSFASDLATPLQNVVVGINSIRSVKDIVGKIKTMAGENALDSITEKESSVECEKTADVVFDKVTLSAGEKKILDCVSFDFMPGKKYLIIGKNGSGKSSLFKLLKKGYTNFSGTISINGKPIESIESKNMSGLVSYLNENVALLSGTIKNNILLFRQTDEVSFQRAMESAHVDIDVNRYVMDGGYNISSGEQRRIEIARSLINSVPVLIFDEVVSTLDIETAYDIEKMVLGYEDKTIIFISHNFSGKLIKDYDEIILMDEGHIIAHGHYNELIDSNEYFRRLCSIKFGMSQ